jgi:hypothetical protein
MKASKQCPKCHSLKVGYLEHVMDREAYNDQAVLGRTVPKGWSQNGAFVGSLEAYLCADCGYFETYLKDPFSIPFDRLQGFHWLNDLTGTGQPYR